MKHLSLLLVALCLAFASKAFSVSGTVYLASFGPATGAKVYLYDSSYVSPFTAGFIDSTTTSGTGGYSFSFTPATNHYYAVGCKICGAPSYNYVNTSGSSATANLYLSCSSFMVRDTVRNSMSGALVSGQKVYIANAGSTYKDSAYTNSLGAAVFYVPVTVSSGTFTSTLR